MVNNYYQQKNRQTLTQEKQEKFEDLGCSIYI